MSQLLEHILNGDYASANDLFEERMFALQERKLYEAKQMVASQMDEVVKPVKGKPGEFTGQNTPKDWAKYRKDHPSIGMYDTTTTKGKKPPSKVELKRKAGHVQAYPALKALQFIKAVTKYHKTGKIDEENIVTAITKAAAEAKAAKKEKEQQSKDAQATQTAADANKKKADASGVTSGMRQVLRKKYREKTGVTATGLAAKSLRKAVAPGTSLGGRYRAVKRAGHALATTPGGKFAKKIGKAAGSGVKAALSDFGSQYGSFEE